MIYESILRTLKGTLEQGNIGMATSSEFEMPAEMGKKVKKLNMTTLWHQRLGHAPIERIKKIAGLKGI